MTTAARLLGKMMRAANARALRFDSGTPASIRPHAGRRYLLYVHVPFCESLCPFCSFHRVQYRLNRAKPYFQALRAEISRYADMGFEFGEVYVGGGTPTILPGELAATLQLVRARFDVGDISVETNPNHLTDPVVSTLQDAGVTRLSVGVQSFDDTLLKRMGRYTAYGSGSQAAERLAAVQHAFQTVNVDLIFNLPQQTSESFLRDLAIIRDEVRATQVSCYPLMAAESTRARMRREMGLADADNEYPFYRMISPTLGPEYQADSVWCFSRGANRVDEYVINHDDYVGVGSGAFGYLHGQLTANTFSLREYTARVLEGGLGITRHREFSRREQLRYHLLMRLSGLKLDKNLLRSQFGAKALRVLWPEITALKVVGALRETKGELHLTRRGMYYWVVLMREFYSGVNRFREAMRSEWRNESRAACFNQSSAGGVLQ
jgi:coproporphyrinogen III oxidase-like Fe-S oxidoreductase